MALVVVVAIGGAGMQDALLLDRSPTCLITHARPLCYGVTRA